MRLLHNQTRSANDSSSEESVYYNHNSINWLYIIKHKIQPDKVLLGGSQITLRSSSQKDDHVGETSKGLRD